MQKKWMTAILPVMAWLALNGGTANAAAPVDARLDGEALITLKLTQDDLNPDGKGTELNRVYEFTSSCESGPCPEIEVARERPDGDRVYYQLQQLAPGVYEGTTSYQGPGFSCSSGPYKSPGTLTETLHLETTTRTEAGQASAVRGRITVQLPELVGPIEPASCAKEIRKLGLAVGDRPTQAASFDGRVVIPVDARLEGRGELLYTVTHDSSDPNGGLGSFEFYNEFSTPCKSGPCTTVTMTDYPASARGKIKIKLRRVAPGVYEGSKTFASTGASCTRKSGKTVDVSPGRAKETVRITTIGHDEDGTEVVGSVLEDLPPLKGPIKPAWCRRILTADGTGVGDRPRNEYRFTGTVK